VNVRMEDSPCLLVVIGATADGHKELVAVEDGIRESEQSWKDLLLNLHRHSLAVGPYLAIADRSPEILESPASSHGPTQWQRCCVHTTANV